MTERRLVLKARMVLLGVTQRDLARALRERGFEVETFDVTRIISGRWNPPNEVRSAIANVLNRSPRTLFPNLKEAA